MRLAHFEIADLAHLVERNLAKVEVAGSSPVIRLSQFSDVRKRTSLFLSFWKNEKSSPASKTINKKDRQEKCRFEGIISLSDLRTFYFFKSALSLSAYIV